MFLFFHKNRLVISLIIVFIFINLPFNRARGEISFGDKMKCAAIGSISPSQAIKCVLDQLGISEEMIQENAKYLNVSNYKFPYPQVTLTFSPTDPKPGEKVTASATPTNFGNPLPDSLYFTWYLQKKDCTLNPPLRNYQDPDDDPEDWNSFDKNRYVPGKKESDGRILDDLCNVNQDYRDGGGIVNIEDYKIKAMRIYAGNGFESTSTTYDTHTDSDGYKAILGGADQTGKETEHCYFHDVKAGTDYEFDSCFHLFPNATGYETGDGSFGANEEKFWKTNPEDSDTGQTGHLDEANVAGLGAKDFTWTYQEGDKIGVAVEGISSSSTLFKDATYKIMWAIPNGTCGELDDPGIFLDTDKLGEGEEGEIYANVDPENWSTTADAKTFTRTLTIQTFDPDSMGVSSLSSYQVGDVVQIKKTETISLPLLKGETSGAGTLDSDTGEFTYGSEEGEIDPRESPSVAECTISDGLDADTAAALAENAENRACCPSEYADEGACSVTSSQTETTVLGSDISTNSIFTLDQDKFNKLCLSKNLVSPTGAGENEPLNVTLSYTPENPANDTGDGSNADTVSINSVVDNPTNKNSLSYVWTLSAGSYSDPDARWYTLTKDQTGIEQTSGTGIPDLKFKLNLKKESSQDDYKYLKIKLNVSEAVSDGTRKGSSEVIIPISSSSDRLSTYILNQSFSAINKDNATAICATSTACKVARNEIIGVKAATLADSDYSFYWTLDGEPLSYKYLGSSFSQPTNEAFFPVLAEEGSSLNIELIATKKDSGQSITLDKTFTVSEPSLEFSPSDSKCAAKKLGTYTDIDGVASDTTSQSEFECEEGSISFQISPYGYNSKANSLSPLSSIKRYQNSTEITDLSDQNLLQFTPDANTGNSFSLSIEGIYTQSNAIKKALRDYWSVSTDSFYEKLISEKIYVTFLDSSSAQKTGQEKILASIISGVPAYFSFLFRIALTTFVLLSSIYILSSLFPNFKEHE